MKYAIAFGAYLVGLTARVVAVKAVPNEFGTIEIDAGNSKLRKEDRRSAWSVLEQNVRINVTSALRFLGIDTGFSISFDHALPARTPTLDLAILAACLGSIGKLPSDWFCNVNYGGAKVFIGSIGMKGRITPTRGVLPLLLAMERSAREDSERQYVVPYANAVEASHARVGTNVFAVGHVSELFDLHEHTVASAREFVPPTSPDHSDPSKLPERVVRAIEIAAIGRHPIHFVGSNAFRCVRLLHALLPSPSREEAMESASMHSIVGLLQYGSCIGERPFRAPHHSVSEIGLIGGGDPIRPGEVSLAHNGVLFLGDLPEFKRGAIERLRDVLRLKMAKICRTLEGADFHANALLATGCTRCPCGLRNGIHSSFCTDERRKEWQRRHTDTLGIEIVVDTDFGDFDKPCTEDLTTLRSWVACGIEFGRREDLAEPNESTLERVARTIANRNGNVRISDRHIAESESIILG